MTHALLFLVLSPLSVEADAAASLALAAALATRDPAEGLASPPARMPARVKQCSCSPECTCGCNEGKPCRCAEMNHIPSPAAVGTSPLRVPGAGATPLLRRLAPVYRSGGGRSC